MGAKKPVVKKVGNKAVLVGKIDESWKKDSKAHTIRYFTCLRQIIAELKALQNFNVEAILQKYSVDFINIDDIPRVSLLFPEDKIDQLRGKK